jgi:rubrerythrin
VGAREDLVRLLRSAYSGELAAAIAYRGNARTVRVERADIARIEREEWDHRERVGRMLGALGARPDPVRERRARMIGVAIALFCRVGGWFAPMYGAGRLESRNIREYDDAARAAVACGHPEFVDDLVRMADVEWEHERYFRSMAASHWLWRFMPHWSEPPPRPD